MKNIDNLICPKCKYELDLVGKSLICKNNHCFDISKEGYVNLLLVDHKKSKTPGDDPVMTRARDVFLKQGYFEELKKYIHEQVESLATGLIVDAGCGTGYYLDGLTERSIGVDISKSAVQIASKNNKSATFIVSSIFEMPIKDKSVDIILNIFAPKPQKEFERVLKDDGSIVEVVPGENHLMELKQSLYECEARVNKEKYAFTEFKLKSTKRITYQRVVEKQDLISLLQMTPYWHTGGERNVDKLDNSQNITFDFIINTWSK